MKDQDVIHKALLTVVRGYAEAYTCESNNGWID